MKEYGIRIRYKRKMKEMEGLSDEEFFLRPGFRSVLRRYLKAMVSNRRAERLSLEVVALKDGYVARTDSRTVSVNSLAPVVKGCRKREEKLMVLLGMLAHELGHVLFTDFAAMRACRASITGEGLSALPGFPEQTAEDFRSRGPGFAAFFLEVWDWFANVFEDARTEKLTGKLFPGIPGKMVTFTRKKAYGAYETLGEAALKEGTDRLSFLSLAVLHLTGGSVKYGDMAAIEKAGFGLVLKSFLPAIRHAMVVYCAEKGCSMEIINRAVAIAYPLICESYERMTGGAESGAEDPGGTGPAGGAAGDNGTLGFPYGTAGGFPVAPMPGLGTKPARVGSKKDLLEIPDVGDASVSALEEINAEETLRETEEMLMETGVNFEILKKTMVTDWMRRAYEEERKEASVAGRTVRNLEAVFKERNAEGSLSGYYTGKTDPGSLLREDGRIFSRELVPEGRPKVSFAVLIDESGSMGGKNIKSARLAAIALEEILRKIGVPYMIAGHTADTPNRGDVLITRYADFEQPDGNDRYRLEGIRARNNNDDPSAIRYMGRRLLERPAEEKKFLIVISDGEPSSNRISLITGIRETREAVLELERKGIRVMAAALSGCAGQLEEIYGKERLLDITDLNSLPKRLAGVIKKRVLSQMENP